MPVISHPTAQQFRLARRVARVVSVVGGPRRKVLLEAMLRGLFGAVVEANGALVEVDPADRAVGARLRRRGVWSEAETALCQQVLRPGMVAVDIGANLGYFTLLFAKLVGPRGHVFAFEPEPHNFALLQRNLARNDATNVTAFAQAVAQTPGVQRLYKNPDNLGDHRLGHGGDGRESVEVVVVALDSLFDAEQRIDFVKLDIQGAEPGALQGARRSLAGSAPLALISELWPGGIRALGGDPLQYLEQLAALRLELSVIAPGRRLRLEPLRTESDRRRLCEQEHEVNLFGRRG